MRTLRRPVPAAVRLLLPPILALGVSVAPARAQDAPPDGWQFRGEVTTVLTAGNAEAFTFGLGSTLENRRGRGLLKLEAGGMRTESVFVTRTAVGTPDVFQIVTTEDRQKTAESYFARARYDRAVSEYFLAYGGVDWMRNTFAGIDSRFLLELGAGNIWRDDDASRFRTSYAATYTFQSDVVEDPTVSRRFPGLRAGWEYWRQVTATTEFDSRLVGDLNLEETNDFRTDFTNSLTVAISDALALKPSLQLLWRNRPSLAAVPLLATDGTATGQTVTMPLEKTDLLFRLALVVRL
jgi:putative salt-induced outer membrane protein YdiY